jgi:hypothetical protein
MVRLLECRICSSQVYACSVAPGNCETFETVPELPGLRALVDIRCDREYSRGLMRSRGLWLLLLVGVVVTLTPLAYASPPDPSWIGGLYDDSDFDDVVVLLTSSVGIMGLFTPSDLQPILTAAPLLPAEQESVTTRPLSANPSRAPPAL